MMMIDVTFEEDEVRDNVVDFAAYAESRRRDRAIFESLEDVIRSMTGANVIDLAERCR